ncbi:MAG: rod shape-determining protein MreC [Patescibacteria group bacterium]|nr:rod shape-determining protein MreC [Patescibacteria group bacterium]
MQSLHKNKKKKKIFIYIIIIILLIVINPFNIFGFVRSIIMVPLEPLTEMGFGTGSRFSDQVHIIFSIGTLYRQNQELHSKVRQLESENAYLIDVKNENETLRKSVNLLPQEKFELMGAEVVLRNPVGGDHWIVINRGKVDGVEIGNSVIVDEGVFVGHIDEVDHATARVQLVTNPESIVNVVTARSGAQAIAYGNHGISIAVEDIKKDDDVIEGDMFITSDVGNKYTRGFSVGRVQNITTAKNNLFQTANVLPLVALDKLRFVFVVK